LRTDKDDKYWTWEQYLSLRALQEAENVRSQLQRIMQRFNINITSLADRKQLSVNVRKALVCGYFMQVAHRLVDSLGASEKYCTVKDHGVRVSLLQISIDV